MRKFVLLIFLSLVIINADPYITVSGYTLPERMGMFGPSVSAIIPLHGNNDFSVDPSLWFSYGIIPRMDITVMLQGNYQDRDLASDFHLYYLMAEARYDVAGKESFAFSPVLDVFMPLDVVRDDDGAVEREPIGLGPGIMSTGSFDRFTIHGNLLSYIPVDLAFSDICLFVAPEYILSPSFSTYIEAIFVLSITNSETSEMSVNTELWPGISWMPVHWLSFNAACGIHPTLDYVSPGISAYFFF